MYKWLRRLSLRQLRTTRLKLVVETFGGLLFAGLIGVTYYDRIQHLASVGVEGGVEGGIVAFGDDAAMAEVESLFDKQSKLSESESFAEARQCLAQAIYFEARSEPEPGWEAVADVVINRVRDKRYPQTICRVVFQGEYRRHSCQFSFACDGLSDRAKNAMLWNRALEIAEEKLIARRVPADTAQATHYHADYVKPYWSEKMVRLTKIGRHIFYTDQRNANF